VHTEVENAYRRARELVRTPECSLLMDISPEEYPSLPYRAYEEIGIGAATGLWRGMHSERMEDCPFDEEWPMYAFWMVGFEYRIEMINEGIYAV